MHLLGFILWCFFLYKFWKAPLYSTSELIYSLAGDISILLMILNDEILWYKWFIFGILLSTAFNAIGRWVQGSISKSNRIIRKEET